MSIAIKNINLKDEVAIDFRTVVLDGKHVQSVNIDQTNGSFIITEPIENKGQVVVYPQSPNNTLYYIKTYKTFKGYGDLNLPLDARFDWTRRKLFISDAGNSRILKVDVNTFVVERETKEIILPHSIVPELNLGGVFVKAFSGINTGVIYYYASDGTIVDYFTFPCSLGHQTTDIQYTSGYVSSLPIPSTMVYDFARWRLWWTSGTYVYTIDIRNRQVTQNNLSPDYISTRGLDIHLESGNVFVVAEKSTQKWYLVQIFRDNNYTSCGAYIPIEDI